jgi:hypothetical protein
VESCRCGVVSVKIDPAFQPTPIAWHGAFKKSVNLCFRVFWSNALQRPFFRFLTMEEKDRNDSRGVPHVNGGVKNDPENVSPSSEILGDEVSPIPYSVFSKWEKNLVSFLIAFASMFSPLSSFIYYPAITSMATDLHVSIELINLSITTYMIVSGIAPAIIGNLSDTVGRRPIYLGTMFIYLAANIGLALQDSYPALLILRMLQSLGSSGIAYPI